MSDPFPKTLHKPFHIVAFTGASIQIYQNDQFAPCAEYESNGRLFRARKNEYFELDAINHCIRVYETPHTLRAKCSLVDDDFVSGFTALPLSNGNILYWSGCYRERHCLYHIDTKTNITTTCLFGCTPIVHVAEMSRPGLVLVAQSNGRWLGSECRIYMIDTTNRRNPITDFGNHRHMDEISCILVVPELRLVLIGSRDKTMQIWTENGQHIDSMRFSDSVCALHHCGWQHVLVHLARRTVLVNIETRQQIREFWFHHWLDKLFLLPNDTFVADGKRVDIATGQSNKDLYIPEPIQWYYSKEDEAAFLQTLIDLLGLFLCDDVLSIVSEFF